MKRSEDGLRLPLSRRELFKIVGAGAALVLLPRCKSSPGSTYRFLTTEEVLGVNALADAILPPDQDPGGSALGTSIYIDHLLSAFEGGGPIWAGGPDSGRAPLPAADGTPSTQFPPDNFASALPMDRVHQLYWKYMIYGSSIQPGPNDAVDGPYAGYRNIVRSGLANAQAQSQALNKLPLEKLDYSNVLAIVQQLLADTTNGGAQFITLLMTLVVQACFAAPEYGGNINSGGWNIAHWEGDRQPLGYSWYNSITQTYSEDPDGPVSTANPGPDPDPIDADTQTIITLTAATQT